MLRKAIFLLFVGSSVLGLAACQTAPETRELMAQNQGLQNELADANRRISQLETDNRLKQQNIDELNRVLGVLDTEKSSRVTESSVLRGQVRKFVQSQIDAYKQFMMQGNLLDYIGGELVERSLTDDRSLLLVDLDHPVPRNGSLTGAEAFLAKPAVFQVKVLRPVGNDLVVIWESQRVQSKKAGHVQYDFPVAVGVEQGDYLGYYFPEVTGVSFDEGTGDTRYLTRDLSLGDSVRRSSLDGKNRKRSYSMGVYGLLN